MQLSTAQYASNTFRINLLTWAGASSRRADKMRWSDVCEQNTTNTALCGVHEHNYSTQFTCKRARTHRATRHDVRVINLVKFYCFQPYWAVLVASGCGPYPGSACVCSVWISFNYVFSFNAPLRTIPTAFRPKNLNRLLVDAKYLYKYLRMREVSFFPKNTKKKITTCAQS